jgi:indolepyruvate ferredoxin oxidoreductase alpha subunit
MILSATDAIALALKDAGIRAAYSFPGSPATRISQRLEKDGRIRHAYCTNEAVAATMALGGAALSGWGTACIIKHVGVNVALDALATGGQVSEYASPCVFIEGIDALPKTSQNVQDNRPLWTWHARMVALEPGSPQECYDLVRQATRLSRICHMPVVVRAEERVLAAKGEVDPEEAEASPEPEPAWGQPAPLISTAATCRFHTEKRAWLLSRVEVPWALTPGSGSVGYLVAGQLGAVAVQGAPTLRLAGSNPLPAAAIRAFCERLDELCVVEEGLPLLAEQVAALDLAARIRPCRPAEVTLAPSRPLHLPPLPEIERAPLWGEHFASARAAMTGFASTDSRRGLFETLRAAMPGAILCTDPGVTGVLGIREGWVDVKLQMGCAAPAAGAMSDAGVRAVAIMGDTNFYHSELGGVLDNGIAARDVLHVLVVNGKSEMTAGVRTPYLGDAALGQLLASADLTIHADLDTAVRKRGPRVFVFRTETDVTADA